MTKENKVADLRTHTKSVATQASVMGASTASGTCASLSAAMSTDEVSAKIGKAAEVHNDEKTRGPGAETWIYKPHAAPFICWTERSRRWTEAECRVLT